MTSVSVRSSLAAGVAAVGVGAVALAPVQPLTPQVALAPAHAAELAVNLAAAVDPITNLVNAVEATGASLSTLVSNWAQGIYVGGKFPGDPGPITVASKGYQTGAPLPILQTVLGNAFTYLGELPDIGTIFEQFFGNIGNAIQAPFKAGEEATFLTLKWNQNVSAAPIGDTGLDPRFVWAGLPTALGAQYADLKPILDFATTPISGLLVGAIGPILAPVLSVVNSVGAAFDYLGDSDFESALYELINIPVNAINAFLNGGPNLDLTPIVGLLGAELPEGVKIGLQMGGLLSPGGVAFDALSATVPGLTSPGLPVGPIGAVLGLTNDIATAIKVPTPNQQVVENRVSSASAEAPATPISPAAAQVDTATPAPVADATASAREESATLSADRAQDDAPAPVRNRQARKSVAAEDNSASAPVDSDSAPKASASRRSAR